jgi:hypothetical protein
MNDALTDDVFAMLFWDDMYFDLRDFDVEFEIEYEE